MLSPLKCVSFQDQEDEDDFELLNLCSSPKKLSRKPTKWRSFGGRSGKHNKNPYADRGLDKYSTLLAELDSKRQKIYTQKGSEDISLLGFVYSDSDDYKPIVVRLRDRKQQPNISVKSINANQDSRKDNLKAIDNISAEASLEKSLTEQPKLGDHQVKVISRIISGIKTTPKNISFDLLKNNLSLPSYYLPVITILILIFLALFGRSFAILCTTFCWYFIPIIQSSNLKKTKTKTKTMKKDYAKAMSYNHQMITKNDSDMKKTKTMKKAMSYNIKFDNELSSPKSVLNGYKSPPPEGHKKSFSRQPN